MLRTEELDYDLPEDRIALVPAEPRDRAKLMVVSRSDESVLEHTTVSELARFLRAGDLLVFNRSRVMPARLEGVREDTGGRVEGLVLSQSRNGRWAVLLRAKRVRVGVELLLSGADGAAPVRARVVEQGGEPGAWVVEVGEGGLLERAGWTPLPPYILKGRKAAGMVVADEFDRERYQTVFAAAGSGGSVAAPTAGLHFTPELLDRLEAAGVKRAEVVLHVGTGTFRPVETETVDAHPMHGEWCELPDETRAAIERTKAGGGRVIAVGTTSARTLESFALAETGTGNVERGAGGAAMETRLLIMPGYRWRWVDAMLTNFHLPRSTLMAMVGGLFPGGVGRVKELYERALAEGYRFYSYGDAMLILP